MFRSLSFPVIVYLGALFFGESIAGDFATLLSIASIAIYTVEENRYELDHPNYDDPEATYTVVYYEKSALMYRIILKLVIVLVVKHKSMFDYFVAFSDRSSCGDINFANILRLKQQII